MMATRTADKPIPMEVLERTAAVLRVLAHPHRLKIIELLSSRGLTVGEVAEAIGILPNACSQHLNIMKAHGVLSRRRDGKAIYYAVEDPNAINVLKCIRKHAG
jgi:DNA-binding transcriptional ArsR family regulator